MRKPIYVPLTVLLTSLALVLLAIVDFRRGFLFSGADYWAKSPFYVFSPWQLVFLLIGIGGLFYARPKLTKVDARAANLMLGGIFVLLVLDAALYRGVAAARSLEAGKIGIDWLGGFGVTGLFRSIALSASYVLTVWHATVLSCLAAGLGLLVLPRLLQKAAEKSGWRGSGAGTFYSLTQPFCSCCVALTSPALFRPRQSVSFALAVLLGAPLLNISTLVLAGSLLPWPFALLRILGGLAITLALSIMLAGWLGGSSEQFDSQEHQLAKSLSNDAPAALFSSWLMLSGRIVLILVPAMIVGTVLSSAIWSLWPTSMGNSVTSVIFTSVVGSLVMVTTWSEIPLASQMLQQGMTGPAATALVALPAVNLGSLLIIGKVSSWKVAVGLALGIMLISMAVGIGFL